MLEEEANVSTKTRQRRTQTKERHTFTLSADNMEWIKARVRETGTSRSKVVDTILDRFRKAQRQRKMAEGYKALSRILKDTAQAGLPLQKKAVPDY